MTPTFDRVVRRATLHDAAHGYDVFGLHPPTLARVAELAAPIYERYFRVDSRGVEHVPARGAAIIVANHSGMLPVDAAMLELDLLRNLEVPRIPRMLADHFVSRLPFVGSIAARCGVVDGTRAAACMLLERDELLVVWAEGTSGPAKPFSERYRLQHWGQGFAELAIRYRAPVVPVAIVGAEEAWPLIGRVQWAHPFGIPYVPVPGIPMPLPAKIHIRYGEPLRFDDDSPERVASAATRVQVAVERLVADALAERKGMFR